MSGENGKGDRRRPQLVNNSVMDKNWKRTFRRSEQERLGRAAPMLIDEKEDKNEARS